MDERKSQVDIKKEELMKIKETKEKKLKIFS